MSEEKEQRKKRPDPLWKRLIAQKPRQERSVLDDLDDPVAGCCLGALGFAGLCAGVGFYLGGPKGALIGGVLGLLSLPLSFFGGE